MLLKSCVFPVLIPSNGLCVELADQPTYPANREIARLLLLWVLGKPSELVHPDGIAAMLAAEARAGDPPPTLPADREAHMDLAAQVLAQEIRALRGAMPAPGGVGVPALDDRD